MHARCQYILSNKERDVNKINIFSARSAVLSHVCVLFNHSVVVCISLGINMSNITSGWHAFNVSLSCVINKFICIEKRKNS